MAHLPLPSNPNHRNYCIYSNFSAWYALIIAWPAAISVKLVAAAHALSDDATWVKLKWEPSCYERACCHYRLTKAPIIIIQYNKKAVITKLLMTILL